MDVKLTRKQVFILILCNYFSLVHIACCVCCLVFLPGWAWKIGSFLACLYFLPLLCTRLAFLLHPIKREKIPLFSTDYYVWWFTFCTQILYLRFPVIEEVMRCVPSLYSFWLRLWGSRIGKLTYWSPGTIVLERSFLRVGDHVNFAAGTRLNPHVHVDGELWLAPIVVEDHVVVGGYSLLSAGTVLKANQATKAFLISPPYSVWQDNHRISKAHVD